MWRIIIGISLIPAFATLYQRLTLPESTRFIASQKKELDPETFQDLSKAIKMEKPVDASKEKNVVAESVSSDRSSANKNNIEEVVKKKAHFSGWWFLHSFGVTANIIVI